MHYELSILSRNREMMNIERNELIRNKGICKNKLNEINTTWMAKDEEFFLQFAEEFYLESSHLKEYLYYLEEAIAAYDHIIKMIIESETKISSLATLLT